jgi:hypothetical protein
MDHYPADIHEGCALMRLAIIGLLLALSFPAMAACPLISLTPCYEVHKPSKVARVVKSIAVAHKAQAARLADLERRLALAEAALKEHAAVLLAHQYQLSTIAK